MSALITATILVFLFAAHTATASPKPNWLPRMWWAIGMCETQLNWKHHTRDYQGAFGFYRGSWDAFRTPGMPTEAYNATPKQQYAVALAIHRRYGFSGWGCVTHGGYRSWM